MLGQAAQRRLQVLSLQKGQPTVRAGRWKRGLHLLTAFASAQVRIHASSLNAGADGPEGADGECTAVIFEEVTRNEAFMYIASSTLVRPHFLPLVAAHVRHHEEMVSCLCKANPTCHTSR